MFNFFDSNLGFSLLTRILSVLVLACLSLPLRALQLEAALHYNFVGTDQNDNLDNGSAFSVNLLQKLPWGESDYSSWLIEAGVLVTEPLLDKTSNDAASRYQVELDTKALQFGARYMYRTSHDVSVYARGGMMLWDMTLDIQEHSSNHGTGSVSGSDNGLGYYWGIGAAFDITPSLYWLLQLSRHQHLDAFGDVSEKPLNLAFTSFSAGLNVGF